MKTTDFKMPSFIKKRRSKWKTLLVLLFGTILGAAVLLSIAYITYNKWNVADKSGYTLFYTRNDYALAKHEPENGAYLGAYVLQNSAIDFSMKKFNELTGRKSVSYFKYVGYGKPFPTGWVNNVISVGGFPHIALEPNGGLDEVKDNEYLREFAKAAKATGVPVFLRFASEMNGTWTNYSEDPEQYKEKWKLVHEVMKQEAPNVAMVWTVLAMPEEHIDEFYPGDEYVDWVGVNVYSVKYHNDHSYEKADFEDPLDLLNYVYTRYSHSKPIQISEFGATHYSVTDSKQDNAFAIRNIQRFYGAIPDKYPRVKAIYYFDVNNIKEYNEARRINDYSVTTEPDILSAYAEAIDHPYYLSEWKENREGHTATQKFSFRGEVFQRDGEIYADRSFFTDYIKAQVTGSGSSTTVSYGGKSIQVKTVSKRYGPALRRKYS
ncbi:glycoside hydrolase family 26 protein [Paenibacillus caui]|uniref:glycoside hydrolase family 26 protein n=1 Tax=Paenibacillus caui TaxID=2873927 RepID=UPI001CA805A8|nr:glycosyl hydrolase [Paenibacillus caui]